MRAYRLRPRLAYMELRADRAYRWNPARREVVGKHLRGVHLHKIRVQWHTE